jgi:parvulin-like peptidyl-prolyl isomerase
MPRCALPFLAALALCACKPPAPPIPGTFTGGGEAIATVNGKNVTSEMVDSVLRTLPPQIRQQLEQAGDQTPLIESLVASELLYQEAVAGGLHLQPLVLQDVAMAERHALAEAQARKIVAERMTEERVKAWYDDHQVQFAQPQIKLAHIMFTDLAKAQEVKAQLDAGGDFAALATQNSMDTMTAPKGGEIGWLELKQMAPALRDQVGGATAGTVIGPLEMGRSVHIFRVNERRDAQPLDEVRDQILPQLEQEVRGEYLDELKAKAVVVETYKNPAPALPGAPAAPEAPAPAAPTPAPAP